MNARLPTIGTTALEAVVNPPPYNFLHCAFFLARNRLLSDETFRLEQFSGQESVSEPFEFQLSLRADTDLAHGTSLSFDDMIGRAVTIGVQLPSQSQPLEQSDRFRNIINGQSGAEDFSVFNGIVTSFAMDEPGVYSVTMKPALWKLSLTNAYAVHKHCNVRDAIGNVLKRHRIAFSMDAVSEADNPAVARVQDWLQAGETDWEFIKRMMGKAHLYFYFVHTGTTHTMVFANRSETPHPHIFPSKRALRYTSTSSSDLGATQWDVLTKYSYRRNLSSSAVNAVITRQEAAWENDAIAQFHSYTAQSDEEIGELPVNRYKIFQYGCSSDEVQSLTQATLSAMNSTSALFTGSSTCALMRAGHVFSITGAEMADSNPMPVRPSLEGQPFVLTQIQHQASADGSYSNAFQASDPSSLIAAYSISDTQQGMVLAQVVEKEGSRAEEGWRYYTADYFDPETNTLIDRSASPSDLSAMGVYVRFSTAAPDSPPVWVKLAPHMQQVPEIGVTVLVTRAQDESELPEIQSMIQANGGLTVMPSTWTANTHVGSSYSTSYGDGKSVRFGKKSSADLNYAEGIVASAYDSGNYKESSYSQGASYSFAVSESNAGKTSNPGELWGPYGGATDLLSASESFGSSYSRLHAKVTSSFSDIDTSYSKSTINKSVGISTVTTQENTSQVGTNTATSLTGAHTSASVTGVSTSADVTGMSTTSQAVGVTNSVHVVGMSNGMSVSGMSNQLGITGVSNNIGLTGMSYSESITGMATSIGATGARSVIEVTGVSDGVSVTGVSTSSSVTGVSQQTGLTGIHMENTVTGVMQRNNVVGVTVNTSANASHTETVVEMMKEIISMNATEMSVTLSNGVTVTMASGRVNTEMSGPDINMPVIKIIM